MRRPCVAWLPASLPPLNVLEGDVWLILGVWCSKGSWRGAMRWAGGFDLHLGGAVSQGPSSPEDSRGQRPPRTTLDRQLPTWWALDFLQLHCSVLWMGAEETMGAPGSRRAGSGRGGVLSSDSSPRAARDTWPAWRITMQMASVPTLSPAPAWKVAHCPRPAAGLWQEDTGWGGGVH